MDGDILLEEDFEAGVECEEDDEELEEEEEEQEESRKMKILRMVAEVASKVKEIIGNLISTAGQVVVTILLGMTGEWLLFPMEFKLAVYMHGFYSHSLVIIFVVIFCF